MEDVFEQLSDYILIINEDKNIVYVNSSLIKRLGYSRLEYLYIQSMLQDFIDEIEVLANREKKSEIIIKDKSFNNLELSLKVVKGTWQNKEAYILIGKETERYYTKDDLEQLLDKIPYSVWIKNSDDKYIYVNQEYTRNFDKSTQKSDIIGKSPLECWGEEISKLFYKKERELFDKGFSDVVEEKAILKGQKIYWETYKSLILNKIDNTQSIIGISKNITPRKLFEEEIAKNYKQLAILHNLGKTNTRLDMKSTLQSIAKDMINYLDSNGVGLFIYDENSSQFTIEAVEGEAKQFLNINQKVYIDRQIIQELDECEEIGQLKEIKYLGDRHFKALNPILKWDKRDIDYLGRYMITYENEFLGMLIITYKDTSIPRYRQDDILKALCMQIAIIMKNIFLLGDTQKEIKKRKLAEKQARTFEEAMHIEILRNEFFADISHDLKTPINIILSVTQLLLKCKDNLCEEKIDLEKYVNLIQQNAYRILKLVVNLIDKSKLEMGYYPLKLENYNIINVIEDITLSILQYTKAKGINLIFDTEIEECFMACDIEKIERIMLNLLSNAVKYIDHEGEILVSICKKEKSIVVSVKDNGIGIPKDKLNLIFERFGQVSSELVSGREGSGIGLALVKSLLDIHKGKIWVESVEGKGSTFSFELPIYEIDFADQVIECNKNLDRYTERCKIEFSGI